MNSKQPKIFSLSFLKLHHCVFTAFLFLTVFISLPAYARETSSFEGAEKVKTGHFTILNLKGTWHDMGRQYGHLMKDELKNMLAFTDKKATAESDSYLLPNGIPCGIYFLDSLFSGVCETSGLTAKNLQRINGVELAYLDLTPKGQCSALALFGEKTKDGVMYYGRNYDWLASFADRDIVLTYFHPSDGSRTVAVINYAGCFYLTTGMNDAGLFVELNAGCYASDEQTRKGFHNAWLLWYVLTQSSDVKQALNLLQSLKGQSCYIIGMADAKETVSYEWGLSSAAILSANAEKGFLAMQNHFEQPGWKNLPSAEEGGNVSSVCRRRALLNLARKVAPGSGTIETMKDIFSVTADCGGAKNNDTLFQVLAIPSQKQMLIRLKEETEWHTAGFAK